MPQWTKNHTMCFRKCGYLTLLQAKAAAARVKQRGKVSVSCYECPYCLRWHLTRRHQPGWYPFPPPGVGTYRVRDAAGLVTDDALVIERNSRGKLYCIIGETTAGRTDRMAKKGFEWFQA